MAARWACSSGASGVLVRAALPRLSPPTMTSVVPSRPVCRAARLEQRAHEVGRGGLAVGAGDAHDRPARCEGSPARQAAASPSATLASRTTSSGTSMRRQRPLDDDRCRAAGDRSRDMVVAVCVLPATRHEEVTRRDPARVVADRGDDRVGLAAVRRQRLGGQQAASLQQRARGPRGGAQSLLGVAATGVSGSRPRRRRARRTQARRPRR